MCLLRATYRGGLTGSARRSTDRPHKHHSPGPLLGGVPAALPDSCVELRPPQKLFLSVPWGLWSSSCSSLASPASCGSWSSGLPSGSQVFKGGQPSTEHSDQLCSMNRVKLSADSISQWKVGRALNTKELKCPFQSLIPKAWKRKVRRNHNPRASLAAAARKLPYLPSLL